MFEKHDDHPEVTPHGHMGSYWTVMLIGGPILIGISIIYWFIASR
jgi:hypothetical protein